MLTLRPLFVTHLTLWNISATDF